MKLSRTVSYALQAILELARLGSESPVPCSRLAAEGEMPERFLLQILRALVAHGILHSTRGVEGGYRLERHVEQISLLEVIEAIDGPLCASLPVGEGFPPEARARLERVLAEVTEIARRHLAAVSLVDLLPASATAGSQDRTRGESAAAERRFVAPGTVSARTTSPRAF